jgi:cytochrome c553
MAKKTGGEHMLHIKNNIATGIAMAVLFMTPVACATTHPASSKATTAPAAPDATVKGAAPSAVMADDSPEAIKLRSGPGDPVAGKDKSQLCQGCHGERGVSIEGMAPKLAGQYGIYIAKQVRNFQSGTRVHEIMSAVAQTVSDDDLADIAAYFASQEKMKGDGHENELGKKLFEHGDMSRMMVACVNCHGVNGKGKSPDNPVFPVIGGQHKDYLRGQLINFRDGDRGNSPGGVMNIITQKLTDEELDALADYVSGR